LELTAYLSFTSIGDLAAARMLVVPEEYTAGLKFFKKNGRMDELMEFLARFVRLVHANRYYKGLLVANCGSSYLDIITASDVAYVLSLIMNSCEVWLKRKTADGKLVKPLYTSGKGLKRVYGVTTWSKSGMKYYRDMMKKWKPAFTRGTKDFKTIRRHWDKWIESSDGGRKVGLANGDATKTAYNVLRTRSEADACVPSDDEEDEDVDHDEEFDYESEEDEIILSNWGGRKSVNMARVNNNSYDSGEEEDDSGSDDDSSDDGSDCSGGGGKHSRDNESGNEDDDGGNVGRGQKYGGDDDSGDDDDEDDHGMSNEGREDEDDEGDDDVVNGGRRLNGLGMMLEEEAVAAGMKDRNTNKKQYKNKRKGGKGLPSEATGERPKRNRRVPERNHD
jgi:hypothetical protein